MESDTEEESDYGESVDTDNPLPMEKGKGEQMRDADEDGLR